MFEYVGRIERTYKRMSAVVQKCRRPGEVLLEKLEAHGLNVAELSELTDISVERLRELVDGRRRFSLDTARLLADLFTETTPEYWVRLQHEHEAATPPKRRIIVVASSSPSSRAYERRDPELRKAALKLVDDGMSSEEAGDAVGGIKKMTVAGWRSARTKGQYDDESNE